MRTNERLGTKSLALQGSVAIYLIVGLSLLFLTTTLAASRLTVSEQRQSTEIDASTQAYYAAEAGVEEAIRRMTVYPDESIEDLFPEQFTISDQPGDRAVVVNDNGNVVDPDVQPESSFPDQGVASWRYRKVTQSYVLPVGTQVKDESLQLDLSDIRLDRGGTIYCDDSSEQGCDRSITDLGHSSVREVLVGTEYCWKPTPGTSDPDIEFTVLSWGNSSPQNVTTNKFKVNDGTSGERLFGGGGTGGRVQAVGASSSGFNCVQIRMNSPTRPHIIRARPLFEGTGLNHNSTAAEHNQFNVDYRTEFMHSSTNPSDELFAPDTAVLIDVTGITGNTKRRLVVKKERSGRILGIFDFAIYSGDTDAPLCKGGVVSDYDYRGCVVTPF